MIIQKISQNLKLISLYDNVPFIFKSSRATTCLVAQKSIELESHQTVKIFSFLLVLQMGLKVDSFLWFLHKIAAFYAEQYTNPPLLHNFQVSQGSSNQTLNNYGFICDAIFFTCKQNS